MLGKAISSTAVPVRAVISGSPVLAARLWAPAAERREKAAEERAKARTLIDAARAAQLAKITDEKARTAAELAHAEADKAARKARRGRAGDVAGGAVLTAVVAGPFAWSVVGPWLPVAFWSGACLWCVAAMAHSPSAPSPADVTAGGAEKPGQSPADGADYDPRAAFLAHVRRGIGAGSGVHLRTLAKQPPTAGFTISEIRALCDRYGVPVSARVKVAKRVTVGVRLADLPALSPTAAQARPEAGSSAA